MEEQEHRCLHCKQEIEVIPGHRKRQYCNDLCRQAAHRERVEKARLEEERIAAQERIQRERAALIQQYGDLLPGTLDLLQSLQSPSLIRRIARGSPGQKQRVRDDYGRERNVLTEEILLMGEQIGFQHSLPISSSLMQISLPGWPFAGMRPLSGSIWRKMRPISRSNPLTGVSDWSSLCLNHNREEELRL